MNQNLSLYHNRLGLMRLTLISEHASLPQNQALLTI